ncbi:MAG: hypothetical protein WDZ35_13580 [Crocinitomicaceae bacterium]
MPKINLDEIKIDQLSDDLIKTTYPPDFLLNATRLEEIREIYTEMCGSEDVSHLKLLVIFNGKIAVSQDIGERYLNGRIRKKQGEALVSACKETREYLNGASALMKKTHPVKVFETEKEATDWLNTL